MKTIVTSSEYDRVAMAFTPGIDVFNLSGSPTVLLPLLSPFGWFVRAYKQYSQIWQREHNMGKYFLVIFMAHVYVYRYAIKSSAMLILLRK